MDMRICSLVKVWFRTSRGSVQSAFSFLQTKICNEDLHGEDYMNKNDDRHDNTPG
ncbi:hypothetical protein PPOLYM_00211 [Paenibacillus polymyxa]|nr:hypothetical protein PPOLYM_00211 [Paenibacillus polymyxa]